MEEQGTHCRNVNEGDAAVLECGYHHGEHVETAEGINTLDNTGGHPCGEMQDVVDNERADDDACPDHGGTGKGCLDLLLDRIGGRVGCAVLQGQLGTVEDVDCHEGEQAGAEYPDQWSEIMEMLGIGIDPVRTDEDGRVAQHVDNGKQDHALAGDCHENL